MRCHQMKHPHRRLTVRAWPPVAKNRPVVMQNLGLNKEIAERRVQLIGGARRQNHFSITGQFDLSRFSRTIGDNDTAQLNIVF